MKTFFITFRSVTYAQRGEKILNRQGLHCTLQRTPRWMEEQGCGYCLRLRAPDAGQAAAVLRGEGLPLRRIYQQKGDGLLEELRL